LRATAREKLEIVLSASIQGEAGGKGWGVEVGAIAYSRKINQCYSQSETPETFCLLFSHKK